MIPSCFFVKTALASAPSLGERLHLDEREALIVGVLFMSFLLVLGYVLLRTLDYFRDRVKQFQPLFDAIDDNYIGIGHYCILPIGMGLLAGLLLGPGWGIALFSFSAVIMLVADRVEVERQRRRVADLCGEIAQAIRCRVALDRFFDTISREHYTSTSLKKVGERLREGSRLSSALGETDLLPPYGILAIQAGESAGGTPLADILQNLSESLRRENRCAASLLTAGLTPLAGWIVTFAIGWTVFNLTWSRMNDIRRTLLATCPPGLFISDEFVQYLPSLSLCLIGVILIIISYKRSLTRGSNLSVFARIVARLPIFGNRLRHRCLARSCHALAAMTRSNVPMGEALRLVSHSGFSGPYGLSFRKLATDLEGGMPISTALQSAFLPDTLKTLMRSGAAGGALADAFAVAAEWHDSRAARLDHILVAAIPCLAIPITGLLVGGVYGWLFWFLTLIRETVMRHAGIWH